VIRYDVCYERCWYLQRHLFDADLMSQIYVRGINRITTAESIRLHFSAAGPIQSLQFCENPRQGHCWVTYDTKEIVDLAIKDLHHSSLNGSVISVRREERTTVIKERVAKREASSACVPRNIKVNSDGRKSVTQRNLNVSYTGRGIVVNGTEYPSPQGAYLMKLLKLSSSSQIGNRQPLMDALLNARHGNRHAKELSESMAMVNAIYRINHFTSILTNIYREVNVFVLADGVMPSTSITMCLFFPTWSYTSIDPILDYDSAVLGYFSSKITCVKALSEKFVISSERGKVLPNLPGCSDSTEIDTTLQSTSDAFNDIVTCDFSGNADNYAQPIVKPPGSDDSAILPTCPPQGGVLNIVIACHSHAPLQEFWDRVPCPKACVSMPCCGKSWSNLDDTPLDVYDDFEVYSPKRRIHLYWNDGRE
jgi:RNA recognition motif. (a.k.a. RRM, RBD, or RNP domain)